ncbi:hypothetical protein vseg_017910 [Gypsophila vaccaria]
MTQKNVLHILLHVIAMLFGANAFSMKMVPINSPDLQLFPESYTTNEQAHFLRDISLSRAFYANKRNSKMRLDSINANYTNIQTNYFVIQFTVGTQIPPLSPIVIVDMLTDKTWIQCAKCIDCFNLTNSFPIHNSTTYSLMTIDDTRCSPKVMLQGACGFEDTYGKGHTKGYMGVDTLSFFDQDKNRTERIANVPIGCGVHNIDFPFGSDPKNIIAGVLGLAIGPKSFITQASSQIKGLFTYCIRSDLGNSTIKFGDDAQITRDDSQTIAVNPNARYHLYLSGITVQGLRLPIDPTIFELDDQEYTRGFFIDPGTTFTVLTHTAYVALKSEVQKHFSKYNRTALPSNTDMFDLCYSTRPDNAKKQFYPSVTLNFIKSPESVGEVNLRLDPSNVFGNLVNKDGFCMQILSTANSTDGPSILGAYQQANFQFLFDVYSGLLSFAQTNCL